MKIVLRYNRKKNDLDYIPWPEPGPVPPIIDPPEPDEPKDGAPPAVKDGACGEINHERSSFNHTKRRR